MFKNNWLEGLQVNSFENILGEQKKNEAESNFEHMENAHLMNFFPARLLT